MLVAQGDKAVVCRYEQIVTRDIRLVVERRPVRLHGLRQLIPEQLGLVRNGPPGGHRHLMHPGLGHLPRSARENRLALLPGIALPVPMIPGGITGRSVAVAEEYVWIVPEHLSAVTLELKTNNTGPSRQYKYNQNQGLNQV